MSVCVYVYVCDWYLGITVQQQSRVYSDGCRGERRLERKTESVTWNRYFRGSPLPSVSLSQAAPQVSPCILCWAWLLPSHHFWDWPTTRSKSCWRASTPAASPLPFTSVCADSQASISPNCLLASWPSSLNSSPLLWVNQSIIFDLILTFHQSCPNE